MINFSKKNLVLMYAAITSVSIHAVNFTTFHCEPLSLSGLSVATMPNEEQISSFVPADPFGRDIDRLAVFRENVQHNRLHLALSDEVIPLGGRGRELRRLIDLKGVLAWRHFQRQSDLEVGGNLRYVGHYDQMTFDDQRLFSLQMYESVIGHYSFLPDGNEIEYQCVRIPNGRGENCASVLAADANASIVPIGNAAGLTGFLRSFCEGVRASGRSPRALEPAL